LAVVKEMFTTGIAATDSQPQFHLIYLLDLTQEVSIWPM
jgi:hypothetical protein